MSHAQPIPTDLPLEEHARAFRPAMPPESTPQTPEPPPRAENPPAPPLKTQFSDILASLRQLADLQLKIWLANVKLTVYRTVMFALLAALAFVCGIIALCFIYAGVYRVLTDYAHIPAPWALLIFAAAHLLAAAILILVAVRTYTRNKPRKAPQKPD
jgi:hypothetical protein